jgi:hypothetical protein
MGVKAQVGGIQELKAKLAFLRSQDSINAITYRGTYGPARFVKELAINNTRAAFQNQSGALLEGWAQKKIKQGTKYGYTVGVRHGTIKNIKTGRDPFYWWFHEFGYYNKPGKFMLTRAWSQYATTAKDQVIAQALTEVYKAADRAVKRFGKGARGSTASMSSRGVG